MSGYGQSSGGFPNQGWQPPRPLNFRNSGEESFPARPGSLPFRSSGEEFFPQRPGTPGFVPRTGGVYSQGPRPGSDMGNGLQMKQAGPSMSPEYWQGQKPWTPPGAPPPPPGIQPPPQQPPPPGQPQRPTVDSIIASNPIMAANPALYRSLLNVGPDGSITFGGQRSKLENGKLVADTSGNTLNPGMGQFGQLGAPGAGGFTLDTSSGRNMILGGANGPQMYNAEGLVQGGQAPQNYVNWLNSYRR